MMSEQVRSAYLLMVLVLVALVAHEIVFRVLGVEEPVFWFLGAGCVVLFLIWVVGVSFGWVGSREPEDWWKLVGIALVGLLGSVFKLSSMLVGFFGFVGFWGLRSLESSMKRKVLGLLLGVEGLLVFLSRSDIAIAYEPTVAGEYLLAGVAGLTGVLLVVEMVRGSE